MQQDDRQDMQADRGEPRAINLALQGGGSHGALTWGVLDRLLEEPRLRIAAVSGTSAGAMNAAVLASGFAHGGAEGAREALARFWRAVSDAATLSPVQRTPWDRLTGNFSLDASPGYLWAESISRVFSPYEFNPFDINPLRDIVARMVDFGALNDCREIRVHVTATNVRNGQARVFSTGEVSCDAVMASACLPQSYKAVEIDGQAYWDGGFSANPSLFPLVGDDGSPDILIVQINPLRRDDVPRTAREIINRVNEISFNTSLIKELRTLGLLRRLVEEGHVTVRPERRLHLHMIHGEEDLQKLAASSKMNTEWHYLRHLFERGRLWAQDWLDRHLDDVGARSSFRLEEMFAPSSKVV